MNKLYLGAFAVFVIPALALAGTSGTEFQAAYTTLVGWAQGDLGRLITVGLLITGIAMGIVRQSIMAAVPAVGAGLVFSVGPGVISAVVGATI